MTIFRTVAVAVIATILITALPRTTWAGEETSTPVSVNLRAAIDRAAAQTLAEESRDVTPYPVSQPAARARQVGGGGGGAGMLVWTLVGTVTSLAGTYFIVKEMRKETDKALAAGQ
jgi:hypothetical protein